MKYLLSLLLFVFAGVGLANAQIKDPVKWTFTAKKIDAKTYQIQITAALDTRWHIYTLGHTGDIGVPTSIKFNKNPLGTLKGELTSSQKGVKMKDPSTGDMVAFYEGKVVFTQTISLKAPVKTTITGTIEYMACDDKMCLPPKEKEFSITLE